MKKIVERQVEPPESVGLDFFAESAENPPRIQNETQRRSKAFFGGVAGKFEMKKFLWMFFIPTSKADENSLTKKHKIKWKTFGGAPNSEKQGLDVQELVVDGVVVSKSLVWWDNWSHVDDGRRSVFDPLLVIQLTPIHCSYQDLVHYFPSRRSLLAFRSLAIVCLPGQGRLG
jgi:hypothetical protein